jgi:hypothetical protein
MRDHPNIFIYILQLCGSQNTVTKFIDLLFYGNNNLGNNNFPPPVPKKYKKGKHTPCTPSPYFISEEDLAEVDKTRPLPNKSNVCCCPPPFHGEPICIPETSEFDPTSPSFHGEPICIPETSVLNPTSGEVFVTLIQDNNAPCGFRCVNMKREIVEDKNKPSTSGGPIEKGENQIKKETVIIEDDDEDKPSTSGEPIEKETVIIEDKGDNNFRILVKKGHFVYPEPPWKKNEPADMYATPNEKNNFMNYSVSTNRVVINRNKI